MRKLKTFLFTAGERETDIDKKIDDWIETSKVSIVSAQSSVSAPADVSDCISIFITIVYE